MLTTDTLEKALDLLELGYTFSSITEETGITTKDAEAVHIAWFNGTSEQVSRELQLAGVLETAAIRLRAGQGWQESTTVDVLNEILHVYPSCSSVLVSSARRLASNQCTLKTPDSRTGST